jgi:SulP family sulfate permease
LTSSPRQSLELAQHRKSVDSDTSLADDERLQRASLRPEVIPEQSEPVTPDASSPHLAETMWQDGGNNPSLRPRPRPCSDVPSLVISEAADENATEETPLFGRMSSRRASAYKTLDGGHEDDDDDQDIEEQRLPRVKSWQKLQHVYPSLHKVAADGYRIATHPKDWDMHQVFNTVVVKPVLVLPSVFLGVLLNLLDALSYGIILFPLGEEVFSKMGADGVSMFYVSCITAQLTYSSGSIFAGGVGSEMIEVVPFFHKMTYMIMGSMGTANPDALRATVITSYAMSSILTGLVFLGLGAAKLGTLVNFFPHSILTGCIGGVGIFLFVTGVEVSARLDGNLELTSEVLHKLFQADTVVLWIPPLFMAILLLTVKHYYDRPWLVPAYYIAITAIFYIVVAAVPDLGMETLRRKGWVFDAPEAGLPFYNFYSYYKFSLVDWNAIWMTVPTQFALTFFGILHVPINVPNLAIVVQEDNVSVNRELIMHGISNTLSGCVGSIQNYLAFVNSVLFIETGGNSRLAGYLLTLATFGLLIAGPVVIGYVPVMVVGTLIYMLGIDLAQEAIVATYGRLHRLEYATIVIISVVMGAYDFVVGIAVGIGLACLVYVVQTSRKTVIRAEFSGAVAESTVRRHPRQREYLHKVGPQIRVVKLGGYLFFGSIVKVEKKVRALIEAEAFAAEPIRYLILDFSHVAGIDFSAAEAFNRMNRILRRRDVTLALASVSVEGELGRSLQMVGLFKDPEEDSTTPPPKVFENLNGALESCENEMLIILSDKQRHESLQQQKEASAESIDIPSPMAMQTPASIDMTVGSPRRDLLHQAANTTLASNRGPNGDNSNRWKHFKQPLPLILQSFQGLTTRNEDFWFRAVRYFEPRTYPAGKILYSRGDQPDGFYLLQSGILRAEYELDQGSYHESIVSGTTCGELPFFSETARTSTVLAEMDCVAWLLTSSAWEKMQASEPDVSQEMLKVGMKLSAERMNAITS